jgi:hypothetical protein
MKQQKARHFALRKKLRALVEQEGAELVSIDIKKAHPHMTFKYQGQTLTIAVAGSPSDVRASRNIQSQVRRVIREFMPV